MFQVPALNTQNETSQSTFNQYKSQMPVKVTNMQLASGPFSDRTLGSLFQLNEELIQQELMRGAGMLAAGEIL